MICKDLEGLKVAKKRLTDKQLREHINAQQRSYRQRHPELYDIWKQRSYANYLRKNGWTVEPPANFPTLEQARLKRDFMQGKPSSKQPEPGPFVVEDFEAMLSDLADDGAPF